MVNNKNWNIALFACFLCGAVISCRDDSGNGDGDTVEDSDGDGLSDTLEAELGTNPESADSDGDGVDDGVEIEAGSDPLDPNDVPDNSTDSADDDSEPEPDAGSSPDAGTEVCAESDLTVERKPVALMLLLDMSGSMAPNFNDDTQSSFDNPDNPGRWFLARPEVVRLLSEHTDGTIQFGYDRFPAPNESCGVTDAPAFDVGPDNNEGIIALLPPEDGPDQDGWTPLLMAMQNYLDASFAPNLNSHDVDSYLLIISDGRDSCGDGDERGASPAELGAVSAQLLEVGIMTFTIGFGEGATAGMTEQLDAISAAGGTQWDTHLAATDPAELEAAFDTLTASIASCSFELPEQGSDVDADNVNFYFEGTVIPQDPNCDENTGWRWTDDAHTEVTFCEAACETLQSGDQEVTAKWGCPSVLVVVK